MCKNSTSDKEHAFRRSSCRGSGVAIPMQMALLAGLLLGGSSRACAKQWVKEGLPAWWGWASDRRNENPYMDNDRAVTGKPGGWEIRGETQREINRVAQEFVPAGDHGGSALVWGGSQIWGRGYHQKRGGG